MYYSNAVEDLYTMRPNVSQKHSECARFQRGKVCVRWWKLGRWIMLSPSNELPFRNIVLGDLASSKEKEVIGGASSRCSRRCYGFRFLLLNPNAHPGLTKVQRVRKSDDFCVLCLCCL